MVRFRNNVFGFLATRRFVYLVRAVLLALAACRTASSGSPGEDALAEEEIASFLDTLQHRTFRWYWEMTNAENGMVPGPAPSKPFASIAAVGFGLTAYGVGAERGYVTRAEAAERTLTTLRFFWNAPQREGATDVTGYQGAFYHFLDMETGRRFKTTELSSIDTALLMMGVLFAQEYFDQDNPRETEIRALADSLYRRVEWDWFQRTSPLITMAWRPERGFGPAQYKGLDEALFLYVLGLGSPTHPIADGAWEAYTSTYLWGEFYGYEYVQFSPLFGYQYSHIWIDPRGLQDAYLREKGIDYFENARLASVANRAYCIDNPQGFEGYDEDIWGLSASQGPGGVKRVIRGNTIQFHGYWAGGASLRAIRDDGTITPTAAGGSVPYAPEVAIPALMAMADRYGEHLYGPYGFRDAFNLSFDFDESLVQRGQVVPSLGWFDSDGLGTNQAPILLMTENHRSDLIWEVMRENPYIRRGLCRAGFRGGWLQGRCE